MYNERRTSERRNERGAVLATAALGMLALLLAVGLGVDISRFYLAKTELQNASDAAALAAVSALNSSSAGITEATDRAVATMNSYEFNKSGVVFQRSNVLFAVNLDGPYMSEAAAMASPANIRFVQVTTPQAAIGVSFAAMIIGNTKNMSATATAGMSVAPNVYTGFLPLFFADNDIPMEPGGVYTVRAAPQNSVSEGNYQVLAVAGEGASDVRTGLASGCYVPAKAGGVFEVNTKPGVNAGPVRAGINTRFDEYDSQTDPSLQPPDTNVKENITYAQYRDGTATQSPTHPGVAGRRIVLIPIVKVSEVDQGRNVVTFDRFGVFFLRSKVSSGNGGDIQAEYISERITIGSGGYDPSAGPGNPLLAIPVLYK
ncbi:MAG TPA: pilus assembly protein TadG-related protein [Pyrinomonadaceae bacterium]